MTYVQSLRRVALSTCILLTSLGAGCAMEPAGAAEADLSVPTFSLFGGGRGPWRPTYSCDCDGHSDCEDGICGYNACDDHTGGNTGECYPNSRFDGIAVLATSARRSNGANALYAALDAYAIAAENGGGIADPAAWSELHAGPDTELNRDMARLAHQTLEHAFGADFEFPADPTSAERGTLSRSGPATVALIEALRDGMVNAIMLEDASVAQQPLAAFWFTHPGYPRPTAGPCSLPVWPTARACQSDHVSRFTQILLGDY